MKSSEANKASETIRDDLAKMAHDLRTPLNAIIGFSQMLMLNEQDATKLRQLEAIHQAGEKLLNMINGIVNPTGKIAEQPEHPDKTELNISAVHFSAADIIVADSAKNNRELISTFLESWPLTVREAQNGQQLLDMVHKKKPDLILTGIKMPVLDGYQATIRLKEAPNTQDIPIIAVTALSPEQREGTINTVFDDCLIKPFNLPDLVSAMMKVLPYKQEVTDNQSVRSDKTLTREALTVLPEPLRQQMYKSIVIGDFTHLRTLIEQIDSKHEAIANGLLVLAEQYDQAQLQTLFAEEEQ